MTRYAIRILLVSAGLLLLAIGAMVLFEPHGFFAGNGVTLGSDPNLMSEIRAPAGLLVASGVLLVLGAVVERLTATSLGLSAMVYGSYGVSRLVSIALDGVPSQGILAATATELIVSGLALMALRSPASQATSRRLEQTEERTLLGPRS